MVALDASLGLCTFSTLCRKLASKLVLEGGVIYASCAVTLVCYIRYAARFSTVGSDSLSPTRGRRRVYTVPWYAIPSKCKIFQLVFHAVCRLHECSSFKDFFCWHAGSHSCALFIVACYSNSCLSPTVEVGSGLQFFLLGHLRLKSERGTRDRIL